MPGCGAPAPGRAIRPGPVRKAMECSTMTSRMMAGIKAGILACGILLAVSGTATAQFFRDPGGGLFGLFGTGSAATARTVIAYPGPYRPGTIVINTTERRLYL